MDWSTIVKENRKGRISLSTLMLFKHPGTAKLIQDYVLIEHMAYNDDILCYDILCYSEQFLPVVLTDRIPRYMTTFHLDNLNSTPKIVFKADVE